MIRPRPPKQFYYWLKRCGIKRVDRTNTGNFYFRNKERVFRINCFCEFQASESFETFDRWANSCLLTHPRIPRSIDELYGFLLQVQLAQERFSYEMALQQVVRV